MYSYIKSLAFV